MIVSGGRWPAWRRAAVPYVVGTRVLDVGCGTGRFLVELCQLGFRATGVELSPEMLRRAALNLASAGYPGRLVLADARRLPFRPESFDSSTVTFPTPVVRDPEFWPALAAILRPGGRVVVVLGARSGQVGNRTIDEFFGRVIARKVDPPDLVAAQPVRRELSLPVPTNCFGIQQVEVEVDRSLVTLVIATKLPETRNS